MRYFALIRFRRSSEPVSNFTIVTRPRSLSHRKNQQVVECFAWKGETRKSSVVEETNSTAIARRRARIGL